MRRHGCVPSRERPDQAPQVLLVRVTQGREALSARNDPRLCIPKARREYSVPIVSSPCGIVGKCLNAHARAWLPFLILQELAVAAVIVGGLGLPLAG